MKIDPGGVVSCVAYRTIVHTYERFVPVRNAGRLGGKNKKQNRGRQEQAAIPEAFGLVNQGVSLGAACQRLALTCTPGAASPISVCRQWISAAYTGPPVLLSRLTLSSGIRWSFLAKEKPLKRTRGATQPSPTQGLAAKLTRLCSPLLQRNTYIWMWCQLRKLTRLCHAYLSQVLRGSGGRTPTFTTSWRGSSRSRSLSRIGPGAASSPPAACRRERKNTALLRRFVFVCSVVLLIGTA